MNNISKVEIILYRVLTGLYLNFQNPKLCPSHDLNLPHLIYIQASIFLFMSVDNLFTVSLLFTPCLLPALKTYIFKAQYDYEYYIGG